MIEIAASDLVKLADDCVALAMERIFPQLQIYDPDIANGLKELPHDTLGSLIQSDAALVSDELGIEEYVAKIIIDAAKRKSKE